MNKESTPRQNYNEIRSTPQISQISCLSHDTYCTNICLFQSCPEPLLCPKCISKHNALHISKLQPLNDFLYDKSEGAFIYIETTLKELSFSIKNFNGQFSDKFSTITNELKSMCKSAKEIFNKTLEAFELKCLNLISSNFDKVNASISKMQSQLDQNQNFMNQFSTPSNQLTLNQKIKALLNISISSLPSLKESLQKNINEFYAFHAKLHSKEFLENFETHLKTLILEPENLFSFSQVKSRLSTIGIATAFRAVSFMKSMKSFSVSPSHLSNPNIMEASMRNSFENNNQNKNLFYEFDVFKQIDNDGQVLSLCFYKDNNNLKSLIVGCSNCLIKTYDFLSGKLLSETLAHESSVKVLVLMEDAKAIASGSQDNLVKIWDISNFPKLSLSKTLIGHNNYIRGLLYLDQMRIILSASQDKTIKIWDFITGDCLGSLIGHQKEIYCLDYLNKEKQLISGGGDSFLKLWIISSRQCVKTIKTNQGLVNCVLVQEKGSLVFTGGSNKTIIIWDSKDWKILNVLEGHTNYICSITIILHGNNKILISGSADHCIKAWNLEKNKCVKTYKNHKHWVGTIIPVPQLKTFVSGSSDKSIIIWKNREEDYELEAEWNP